MKYIYALFAFAAIVNLTISAVAEIVFFDDFNAEDGTLLDGRTPPVGGAWRTADGFSSPAIFYGIVDSEGEDRRCFADLARPLGTGEVLTITIDAAPTLLGSFFPQGYAGVSLFVGTSEAAFIGSPWEETSWGLDQAITGSGIQLTTETDEDATAVVTYVYDTGDWSMTISGLDGIPETISGTGTQGLAFDNLRYANGDNGVADMALDSVEVDISTYEPEGPVLTIYRETGQVTLSNANAAGSISIAGYSIASAIGALNPTAWQSIADNSDADSGGSVDPINIWTVSNSSPDHVAENTTGAAVFPPGMILDLGTLWFQHPNEDIEFSIMVDGQLLTRAPWFVGNNGESFEVGDLNFDGQITAIDWSIFKSSMYEGLTGLSEAQAYARGDFDADGDNDLVDFGHFRQAYDAANGAGAFDAMIAGVPEPASLLILLVGAAGLLIRHVSPKWWRPMMVAWAVILLFGLLFVTRPAVAEVIGTDSFDYTDGSIIGQAGGGGWDWDNTIPAHSGTNSNWNEAFGTHSVQGGTFVTADGGAWREYNGPTEGVSEGPPETDERLGAFRAAGLIYYGADFRVDVAPGWAGMSSYDFGAERIFFGMPYTVDGLGPFGIDESGVGTSLTTIPVVVGQTYRLVAAIDFDGDELRLWVNPNSSDFDAGTGNNSADVTRAYTGTNWSTAVRLASGAGTTWDNLIVATDFSDLNLPAADLLTLQVNTTTGAVSMRNDSGATIDINGYAILSAGGALSASGWNSFQDQDLVSFPAGDGTGNGWEETGIPDSGYLGEAFLLGNSTFADQLSIDLGMAFRPSVFGQNNDGDLVFHVRLADGGILDGLVEYVTGGVVNNADFNGDGNVDGTDFLTWQIGFGTTGTASLADGDANNDTNVDGADLAIWRSQFGTVGSGSRGLAGLCVPEPATCVLAILGLLVLILGWIRSPMSK